MKIHGDENFFWDFLLFTCIYAVVAVVLALVPRWVGLC
jgi:hypothetical protein